MSEIDSSVDQLSGYGYIGDSLLRKLLRYFDKVDDDVLMDPDSVAEAYWYLHNQKRDAWTFELDVRPFAEKW